MKLASRGISDDHLFEACMSEPMGGYKVKRPSFLSISTFDARSRCFTPLFSTVVLVLLIISHGCADLPVSLDSMHLHV